MPKTWSREVHMRMDQKLPNDSPSCATTHTIHISLNTISLKLSASWLEIKIPSRGTMPLPGVRDGSIGANYIRTVKR